MIRLKTNGLFDGEFTRLFRGIYVAGSSKMSSKLNIPLEMKEYIEMVNSKLGGIFECNFYNQADEKINLPKNKKVMVAFSSGKDCVACATKFIEKGYEVFLYHLKGVNRSYPQELEHSKLVADYLGCTLLTDTISVSGKCDYIENPTRNQFILSMMVDKGLSQGIYRYAFGNMICDTLEGTNPDIMNSDSIELFSAIEKYYQSRIEGFRLFTILRDITDSYCQVSKYDSDLFKMISSCNGPLRFKAHRHKEKEEKFGVTLLPDRCGTCYKCANEIVVLNMLGVLDYPDEYIEYCKGVMDSWTNKLYTGQTKGVWYDEKYIRKFAKKHGDKIKKIEFKG